MLTRLVTCFTGPSVPRGRGDCGSGPGRPSTHFGAGAISPSAFRHSMLSCNRGVVAAVCHTCLLQSELSIVRHAKVDAVGILYRCCGSQKTQPFCCCREPCGAGWPTSRRRGTARRPMQRCCGESWQAATVQLPYPCCNQRHQYQVCARHLMCFKCHVALMGLSS